MVDAAIAIFIMEKELRKCKGINTFSMPVPMPHGHIIENDTQNAAYCKASEDEELHKPDRAHPLEMQRQIKQALLPTTTQASIPVQTQITTTPAATPTEMNQVQPNRQQIVPTYAKAITAQGIQIPPWVQTPNSHFSHQRTPICTMTDNTTVIPVMPIANATLKAVTIKFICINPSCAHFKYSQYMEKSCIH